MKDDLKNLILNATFSCADLCFANGKRELSHKSTKLECKQ